MSKTNYFINSQLFCDIALPKVSEQITKLLELQGSKKGSERQRLSQMSLQSLKTTLNKEARLGTHAVLNMVNKYSAKFKSLLILSIYLI